jgi:hypothetical protein
LPQRSLEGKRIHQSFGPFAGATRTTRIDLVDLERVSAGEMFVAQIRILVEGFGYQELLQQADALNRLRSADGMRSEKEEHELTLAAQTVGYEAPFVMCKALIAEPRAGARLADIKGLVTVAPLESKDVTADSRAIDVTLIPEPPPRLGDPAAGLHLPTALGLATGDGEWLRWDRERTMNLKLGLHA